VRNPDTGTQKGSDLGGLADRPESHRADYRAWGCRKPGQIQATSPSSPDAYSAVVSVASGSAASTARAGTRRFSPFAA
jgi:hypothetical protein